MFSFFGCYDFGLIRQGIADKIASKVSKKRINPGHFMPLLFYRRGTA
jgi:hypothetical protein